MRYMKAADVLPPDAAGSLWSEEIDALRRELS